MITSIGSTGDVQPLIALAHELRQRGHGPVLALSPNFTTRAEEQGFEFIRIGPELDPSAIKGVVTAMLTKPDVLEQVKQFLAVLKPAIPELFRDLRQACHGADVLISTPYQVAGRMTHDSLGIPFVSVHLSQFGSLGNKAIRELSASVINECRAAENLNPVLDPLGADGLSPQLALYAVSKHIMRLPPAGPQTQRVTGFFYYDENEWEPDPRLLEFMEAGDKPIAITFGSIVHDDPEAVTEALLAAVSQAGCRAILQQGWGGLARGQLPGNALAVGFVPHRWLFDSVRCVVHHGGAGTTAAAFRAGVPTVVVPHTLDQPIWGEFARAVGCASAVIPFYELTPHKLSNAITAILSSTRYSNSAELFARRIREENGVVEACRLIEGLVQGSAPV